MPKKHTSHPAGLALDGARLMAEAGTVMAIRLSMLGWRAMSEAEMTLMFREKPLAFAAAQQNAALAASRRLLLRPGDFYGAGSDALEAWMRSLTGKARGNRKRLSRRAK